MAVSTIGSTNGPWNVSNTTISDIYDGNRYYAEQERRYREEMERERQRMYMAQNAYNPYTDTHSGMSAQQMQEEKTKAPVYTMNKKLLLLEN